MECVVRERFCSLFSRILRSLFDQQLIISKMSDAAAAPAAPAKATKKRAGGSAKAKKPSDHPKYADMIKSALSSLKVCKFTIRVLSCILLEMLAVISCSLGVSDCLRTSAMLRGGQKPQKSKSNHNLIVALFVSLTPIECRFIESATNVSFKT